MADDNDLLPVLLFMFISFFSALKCVYKIGMFMYIQGCGNTMPDLSDLVPFHSGQVDNFNLLVLGQVQNLYKVNKILYLIF